MKSRAPVSLRSLRALPCETGVPRGKGVGCAGNVASVEELVGALTNENGENERGIKKKRGMIGI
jgi:hypothetical protein